MNQPEMSTMDAPVSPRRTVDRRKRESPLASAMSFRLPPATHDAICQVAEELGISVAEVVRRALAIVERRSRERRGDASGHVSTNG